MEDLNERTVDGVRYVAREEASCIGCAFTVGSEKCHLEGAVCSYDEREDGRSIIWIRADQQPEAVTDPGRIEAAFAADQEVEDSRPAAAAMFLHRSDGTGARIDLDPADLLKPGTLREAEPPLSTPGYQLDETLQRHPNRWLRYTGLAMWDGSRFLVDELLVQSEPAVPAQAVAIPAAEPCACFPGTCRGGEVVNGRTPAGQRCKACIPAVELREAVSAPQAAPARNADLHEITPAWRKAWAAMERIACRQTSLENDNLFAILRDYFNMPNGPAPQAAPCKSCGGRGHFDLLGDECKACKGTGSAAAAPSEQAAPALPDLVRNLMDHAHSDGVQGLEHASKPTEEAEKALRDALDRAQDAALHAQDCALKAQEHALAAQKRVLDLLEERDKARGFPPVPPLTLTNLGQRKGTT